MTSHQDDIRRQFGAAAADYVTAASFAAGDDLEILASWAEGGEDSRLLDVATGGGHTALRLSKLYGQVVASDLTEPMLDAARSFIRGQDASNIEFVVADAENLPFEDGSFDAVSCRIAPHHFPSPGRFVQEVARVLRDGGTFLLEDTVAPSDYRLASILTELESLRDPTHVRSLTQPEWTELLRGAGFDIEHEAIDRKRHDLEPWMDRSRTPQSLREQIRTLLGSADSATVAEFKLTFESGLCTSYTDEKLLMKARKQSV